MLAQDCALDGLDGIGRLVSNCVEECSGRLRLERGIRALRIFDRHGGCIGIVCAGPKIMLLMHSRMQARCARLEDTGVFARVPPYLERQLAVHRRREKVEARIAHWLTWLKRSGPPMAMGGW